MSIVGRIAASALALTTGAVASQGPEFAQQYRQRLGGTVDELARVVTRFDEDAAAEGLARDDAIARYERAGDAFLARRGISIRADVARLASLRAHAAALEASPAAMRPLLVARDGDMPIARATLSVYEPALPLTAPGMLYGLSGAFAGILAWWLGVSAARPIRLSRRRSTVRARRDPPDIALATPAETNDRDGIVVESERRDHGAHASRVTGRIEEELA